MSRLHPTPTFYTISYLRSRCKTSEDDCWIWQGTVHKKTGYGYVRQNQTGAYVVHKVMYILVHGMVPHGLELDHTCKNRKCCNPDHLEPVTHLENMQRGQWANATECVNGHPFIEGSYRLYQGRRLCIECGKKRSAEHYRRNAASTLPVTLLSLFPVKDEEL